MSLGIILQGAEAPVDCTLRLPVEMLSYVFDNLRQPDVLRAARVSHRWREVLIMHRSYFAHLSLRASQSAPWSADRELRVALFCNQLRRCRLRRTRISLDLNIEPDSHGWLRNAPDGRSHWLIGDEQVPDPFADRVLPAIAECLEFIIKLRIQSSVPQANEVYAALRRPAPQLESLILSLGMFPDDAEPPPCDLFANHAPRLTVVELFATSLPPAPVVAFTNARDVQLCFIDQPPLQYILASFPQPGRLAITCGFRTNMEQISWDAMGAEARDRIFGPRLQTLSLAITIDDCPRDISAALATNRVPVLNVDFEQAEVDLAHFLHRLPRSLALTIHASIGSVKIHLAGLASQDVAGHDSRRFTIERDSYLPGMLLQLQSTFSRVREMDLLHEFLLDFLYEVTVRSLPQLAVLRIDTSGFVSPGEYGPFWPSGFSEGSTDFIYLRHKGESSSWDEATSCHCVPPEDTLDRPNTALAVECPSLRRLELYSTAGPPSMVDRREIIHLARDFSLLRSEPCAVLLLKDVEIVGSEHVAMAMIFSGIHEERADDRLCHADSCNV